LEKGFVMTRSIIVLLTLTFVAACGANDPPFRPTGQAAINTGQNGVATNAGDGATNGTFSDGLSR
jgi:hypothetical protein